MKILILKYHIAILRTYYRAKNRSRFYVKAPFFVDALYDFHSVYQINLIFGPVKTRKNTVLNSILN